MNKKSRNKGFSLIEIIVTIAIMAVVAGGSVAIYSGVGSHKMKEIVGNIDNAMSDMRSDTLSKEGSYELIIRKSSDKYVAVIERTVGSNVVTETKTISKYGSIYCVDKSSSMKYTVGTDYEIHISFNKTDGSFSTMSCWKTDGSEKHDITNYIYADYSGLSKRVKMLAITGKHYIENN